MEIVNYSYNWRYYDDYKKVKEDTFNLKDIHSIDINANIADINVTITDDEVLKINQFSKKKVDSDLYFEVEIFGNTLTLLDQSKQVDYFLGIEASPGISYDIEIPKSYKDSINIDLNSGNISFKEHRYIFEYSSLNIGINRRGNIFVD